MVFLSLQSDRLRTFSLQFTGTELEQTSHVGFQEASAVQDVRSVKWSCRRRAARLGRIAAVEQPR